MYCTHCSNPSEEKDMREWLAVHLPKEFTPSAPSDPAEELQAENPEAREANLLKEEGNKHFKAKQYKQAIASYTAAVELDGSNHAFFGNRSACHLALKNTLYSLYTALTVLTALTLQ
jgi:hypothetical protein